MTSEELLVTVRADDLSAVLAAADYVSDRSLIGPVDRMSDVVALARMRAADGAKDTEQTMEGKLHEIEVAIMALPELSTERCEALAFYFMTLARAQWRKADRLRQLERERANRKGARR